jgi:tRNA threonylcarbamoyladenosine biosynthesis protein TsaB
MLLLGIETSTPVSTVALWSDEGPVAGVLLARGRGHVEFLMPSILSLTEHANVRLEQLTGIAVGLGPGLFTGMRVGIATAKTLAQVLDAPIAGISSLDLLAFNVRHSPKLICACVDARRGEVFAAFYRQASGGVARLSEYAAWEPKALAGEVLARAEEVLFVGNGAHVYHDELADVGAEVAAGGTQIPRAEALCELAAPRFARDETPPVAQVEPLYVRRSDAEIKWEGRGVAIQRPDRVQISKKAMEGRV